MYAVLDLLGRVAGDVWRTFEINWPYLLFAVVAASALPVYVGTQRLAAWLRKKVVWAVIGSIILASVTPFCSCGTTAIVLGALASSVPWAPIVTFMVTSPLTSPGEYIMSTGLFGFSFATTFFVAAVVLGLLVGTATHLIEKTGWLRGQARMADHDTEDACGTDGTCGAEKVEVSCCGTATEEKHVPAGDVIEVSCCGTDSQEAEVAAGGSGFSSAGRGTSTAVLERAAGTPTGGGIAVLEGSNPESSGSGGSGMPPVDSPWAIRARKYKLDQFGRELWKNTRRLALYFFGFAALGYLLIELIPTHVLTNYLGGDSVLAVPLAALIGIPVYLNSDGSLPLVATMMEGGMGPGPALAFLVTGAGTSVGAFSGMLLIARAKIVGLIVGSLFVGAIVLGYLAPLWL